MPYSKQVLDPPFLPLPIASSSRTAPRLPKRLSSKHSPAPNTFPDPSSGLLALLVTVAGSAPVDGRPFDSDIPDFLCPRLHNHPSAQSPSAQETQSWYYEPCDASEVAAYSESLPTPLDLSTRARRKRVRRSVNIADKYELSPDGRWRKVDYWELYGSSSCAISQCMEATPTEMPVQDDQLSASTGATVPESSASSPSSSSSAPNLPHGWGGSKPGDDMTGIILGLSLSLALSLIGFMIGIVLWRRKKRRKREKDAEKIPPAVDTGGSQAGEDPQRVRSKQRLWQRAAAKWRANVKHSARRRRKFGMAPSTRPSDADLLSDRAAVQASTSALSLARTQTVSDHDSAYATRPLSIRGGGSRPPRSRSPSLASSDYHANPPDTDPLPSPSSRPPAYIPDATCEHTRSRGHLYHTSAHQGSYSSSAVSSSVDSSTPSAPLPYEPPVHSAHVATDDKAVLAQMARMASAPPSGDEPSPPCAPGRSSEVQPSVPVFEDDPSESLLTELQLGRLMNVDDGHGTGRASTPVVTHDTLSPATHVPYLAYPGAHVSADDGLDSEVPSYAEDAIQYRGLVLPPPPSKVPLTGPTFYEYPNEFEEDIATIEPPPGPSSPPFEEPSAPPFEFEDGRADGHMIVPSAPPLDVEDEPPHMGDVLPFAPPLEDDDNVPVLGPRSLPVSSEVEPSTPLSVLGGHRDVNAESRSGSASPQRVSGCACYTSPPRYLP